jgi:hypothetical protein
MTNDYKDAYRAFEIADRDWRAELLRVYGREAGTARYLPLGKGAPGTTLHKLHLARKAARMAWWRAVERERARKAAHTIGA